MSGDAISRRTPWVTLFAVAMGFLEAAVVVYLRELYYPDGFRLPMLVLPDHIALIELLRELATLLMLFAVAMLAGTDRTDRFFVFTYVFGVWDIVYYLGLWAFLGWPESLYTWDILFLIPLPWLGPVFYPVVVSLMLIGGFLVYDALRTRGHALRPTVSEWLLACAGACVIVVAFCWNWRTVPAGEIPTSFPAAIFFTGLLLGTAPFVRAAIRSVR